MKKKLLILLLAVIFLGTTEQVNAARVVCTKSRLSQLKTLAYQVTANYELHTPDFGEGYFTITLSNLSPGIIGEYGPEEYRYEEGKDFYLMQGAFEGGQTISISFYVDEDMPCVGEFLFEKKVTLPKYNVYSSMSECIEYEEFPLCNKWYQGKIESIDDFKMQLIEYKESLNKKPHNNDKKEEKGIIEKIVDFYNEHIIITGPITFVAVVGLGYYGVRKYINKKKRAKISFK